MNIWPVILGMALVSYLQRMLPLAASNGQQFPPWIQRALDFVPLAILSALIGAAFIPSEDWLVFTIDGRLLAGLVAIGLALLTRSVMVTIMGGLAVLFLLG